MSAMETGRLSAFPSSKSRGCDDGIRQAQVAVASHMALANVDSDAALLIQVAMVDDTPSHVTLGRSLSAIFGLCFDLLEVTVVE